MARPETKGRKVQGVQDGGSGQGGRKPWERCPKCGLDTPGFGRFYEHVEVVDKPNGGITTESEVRLERLCGWCGFLLEPPRAVVIEDVASL